MTRHNQRRPHEGREGDAEFSLAAGPSVERNGTQDVAPAAATWRRRADAYRAAAPRPEDFPGRATPADLRTAGERVTDLARLAELHATLIESGYFANPEAEIPPGLTGLEHVACPYCHGTGRVPAAALDIDARGVTTWRLAS